jgi:hypothetical protein
MNRPPNSVHTWRQSNTLAVARNFYEESMNIFKPRVDNRKLTNGVTGMQFPSMEYIFALTYHITGEQYWVARFLTWCMFIMGVLGLYAWIKIWLNHENIAYYSAAIFMFIPELFYHCINPLPDILALSAGIWAMYFFSRFQQQKTWKHILFCTLFATLAGLTKIQYLAIGFFMVTVFFMNIRTYSRLDIVKLGLFGTITVGLSLLWYKYAVYLIHTSGLLDFGIEIRPAREWNVIKEILKQNLISDLPELLLGFTSFVLFLYGLTHIKKAIAYRQYFIPILIWSIALLIYHGVELSQMKYHQYYMMPYLPVLALIAGYGMQKMVKYFKKWVQYAAYACFYLVPVIAIIRIYPARWITNDHLLADELYYAQTRETLQKAIPDNTLCMVGPDVSGAIFLYMLHKKGTSVLQCYDLISEFEKYKSHIKYLYWYEKECKLPEQVASQVIMVQKTGNFSVYRVKEE